MKLYISQPTRKQKKYSFRTRNHDFFPQKVHCRKADGPSYLTKFQKDKFACNKIEKITADKITKHWWRFHFAFGLFVRRRNFTPAFATRHRNTHQTETTTGQSFLLSSGFLSIFCGKTVQNDFVWNLKNQGWFSFEPKRAGITLVEWN